MDDASQGPPTRFHHVIRLLPHDDRSLLIDKVVGAIDPFRYYFQFGRTGLPSG